MMILNIPTLATRQLTRPCLALMLICLFTTLMFSPTASAQSQLIAKVDRTQVSLEETLKLTLRYNEQVMFGEPDISQLKVNFDVLGNHKSNQYRSINGRAESWTQWSLTLAPKKEGKLLIPSFKYEGAYSEAIEIDVKKATSYQGSGSDKPVFIETDISKPKAFVQEQLIYTIRLFTSVDITGINRQDFAVENALLKQVAESQYQRNVGGRTYSVIEIAYALFPQQSGTLTIPAHAWDVSVQSQQNRRYDPFLSRRGQRLRLRIEQRDIDVLPKPSNYTGEHWLPADSISLSQNWSQDPNSFKVGEPITRTVTINAKGLMPSQLPPLTINETPEVKYYPDQPQSEETLGLDGITTTKAESYAIVPSRAGKFTLPAVSLTWWDTQAKRMREASLPVQTITVIGEVNVNTAPTSEPNHPDIRQDSGSSPQLETEPGLWLLLSASLALLCIVFASLWGRARSALKQQTQPAKDNETTPLNSNERSDYKALKESLKAGDANRIRHSLLRWGQSFSHHHNLSREPLSTLKQLGKLSSALDVSIAELESQLYSEQAKSFNASALAQAIEQLRKKPPKPTTSVDDSLPPLYHAR